MKIALPFLNTFKCSYAKQLPVSDTDNNTQVGTGEIHFENNTYTAELQMKDGAVKKPTYLSCRYHKKESNVLHIDELVISKEKPEKDFSVQLGNVIF